MTFAQLNFDTRIEKAIDQFGFKEPTPIQAKCIPSILEGKDIIASARTGTGKTGAFMLPMLHKLSQTKSQTKPRILILTPTRELAAQITQNAVDFGKYLNVSVVNLVGGMPYRKQIQKLSRPLDIIVATPGRLIDHLENRRADLSGVETLVLDEADRMLDMGFIDDVQFIAKSTPKDRQTLLFSATINEKLAHIVKHLLKNPIRINLSEQQAAPQQIKQFCYLVNDAQHKKQLFHHILKDENIYKAIIFSATKINADRLASELNHLGFHAEALHGDLTQNKRNKTIEQLRRGKIQFLVATDVAARGIDVSDITHVMNYDLPKFCEDYVHRIGRTGRAGKEGAAISFVMPADMRHLQRIERFTKQAIQRETIPGLEPKASKDTHHHKKKFSKESGRNQKFAKKKPHFKERFAKEERFSKEERISKEDGQRKEKFSKFSNDRQEKKKFSKESGYNSKKFAKKDDRFKERYAKEDRPYKDKFSKDKFSNDSHQKKQFSKDKFSKDKFSTDSHRKKEFSKDKFSSDSHHKKEFAKDKPSHKKRFAKENEHYKEKFSKDKDHRKSPFGNKKQFAKDRSSAFNNERSDNSEQGEKKAHGKKFSFKNKWGKDKAKKFSHEQRHYGKKPKRKFFSK